MERIGPERQGLVRELFRNLVTAQGTRAVVRPRGAALRSSRIARPRRKCCGQLVAHGC